MPAFKKIGCLTKSGNTKAQDFIEKLLPVFQKHGCEVYFPESAFKSHPLKSKGTLVSDDTFKGTVDLVLVLGGDGTLLRSVRLLEGKKVPVCGVKLGEVGFLAELPQESADQKLDYILQGNYAIEEIIKLEGTVIRSGKKAASFQALNDIVLHTSGLARIANFELLIDGQPLGGVKADGVLVATPTGSTAYSYAAGGPIVEPRTKLLILTPICPHGGIDRPLVVSSETEIEVQMSFDNSQIMLTADGQEQFSLQEGDVVRVSQSDQKAYFLKSDDSNYIKTLKKKIFSF